MACVMISDRDLGILRPILLCGIMLAFLVANNKGSSPMGTNI